MSSEGGRMSEDEEDARWAITYAMAHELAVEATCHHGTAATAEGSGADVGDWYRRKLGMAAPIARTPNTVSRPPLSALITGVVHDPTRPASSDPSWLPPAPTRKSAAFTRPRNS